MIDKQLLQKRFSTNAQTYDQFANVQKKMANALFGQITIRPERILEIGCGTGYLTEKLRRHFPHARITAVDLAPGMIAVAKQRLDAEQINWICGDIEEIELSERYDLIISNATFQWLNDLDRTLLRLYDALNDGGQLVFSTFGARTFHELHTSFACALKTQNLNEPLRIGQSFPTLNQLLGRCQCTIPSAAISAAETIEIERFPSVRDFFLSLRKIGATNSTTGRYCQRPSVFKAMMSEYEHRFSENGQIFATYHCLFIDITRL
ncbi:malonyl-ACP O-methyltransferase BioC [Thermolongibacillus altinsuensis]|uniref:malonyl-ACP O-methyltransferase BioC n=1 Tax=Thermolongibacillus altinsuensis TaxID=575256 RepID=UPI00242A2D6B|nr:malonyl-ACP O-methyltransferase BioC [Thermolongibacillus altinsuensis]GMB07937.1 malonyl-[acyl-carrier protein] O-methyltransferase [Thermolongibacillus altinsuensis]